MTQVPSSSRAPSSSSGRTPSALLALGVALALALGAALASSLISAAPASAHAELAKITPAANEHLTTAPRQVVLEFSEPVSAEFVTVVVTTAAGVSVTKGKATVLGNRISQPLSPDVTSGDYRIAFQVTSADGHPVTGQSKFTLMLASSASPKSAPATSPAAAGSASPPPPEATAKPAKDSSAGQPSPLHEYLVPISGAVLLLIIGSGVLLWERRQR